MSFEFDWTKYKDSTGNPLTGMPNRIAAGASAIIFDDDGWVLMEKRSDNGFWGLPGGAVDIGESVQDAVVREVLEETGLTVEVTRLVGIYSDPDDFCFMQYPDGNLVHSVVSVFECAQIGGQLQVSEESTDLKYHPIDSLPEQVLLSHRIRITDAALHVKTPFVK
ncbi:MAG: NUDIX domain-containing protein [SAR202 cluster bacterium]|jgi:8-oxo-dGTP pyrophosphatase MutT (NUDIX family)|nr:NUDIX domain-containing protein [SAR202 cluster bacterium]